MWGILHEVNLRFWSELRYCFETDVRPECVLNVRSFLLSFSKSWVIPGTCGSLVRWGKGVICFTLWFRNSEPIWSFSLSRVEWSDPRVLLRDQGRMVIEKQGRPRWNERWLSSHSLIPWCSVALLQLDDLHFDGRPFYFLFRTGTDKGGWNGTQIRREIERPWLELIWWVLGFI